MWLKGETDHIYTFETTNSNIPVLFIKPIASSDIIN